MTSFRPFFNPATGEWITCTAIAVDSDGQLVRFHWRSAPGGVVPELIHPRQEERFTIAAGQAHFTLNGQKRVASAGQTIVMPAGVPHSRETPDQPRSTASSSAARHGKPRSSHEAVAGLAADGKTTPAGAPKNSLQLGAILWRFRPRKPGLLNARLGAEPDPPPAAGAGQGLRRTPPLRPLGQPGSGQLAKATQNHPQPPAVVPKTRIARHDRPLARIPAAGPRTGGRRRRSASGPTEPVRPGQPLPPPGCTWR